MHILYNQLCEIRAMQAQLYLSSVNMKPPFRHVDLFYLGVNSIILYTVRFRVIKHTSIIQNLPLKLSKRMGYLEMFQKLFLFFVFTKLFANNESKTILTTTGILSLNFFRNPGFPKVSASAIFQCFFTSH